MLLHASQLWPEAILTSLWSFALKYAEHMHNHIPWIKMGYVLLRSSLVHQILMVLISRMFILLVVHAMFLMEEDISLSGIPGLILEFLLGFLVSILVMLQWFSTLLLVWYPFSTMWVLMITFRKFKGCTLLIFQIHGEHYLTRIQSDCR